MLSENKVDKLLTNLELRLHFAYIEQGFSIKYEGLTTFYPEGITELQDMSSALYTITKRFYILSKNAVIFLEISTPRFISVG